MTGGLLGWHFARAEERIALLDELRGPGRLSIPKDVKREFQETFAGENRSAVITELMRQAIEEKKRAQREERQRFPDVPDPTLGIDVS